ncbi:MAG: hypothetical protein FP831_02600 [Anaerolineae bacterium]|nr:hypothetical protein [Anaerolineae bacterium]
MMLPIWPKLPKAAIRMQNHGKLEIADNMSRIGTVDHIKNNPRPWTFQEDEKVKLAASHPNKNPTR